MKKIYLSLLAVAATLSASAQLTNTDFAKWIDCVPWTSDGNTLAIGTTPEGWTISNVIGIKGTGKTQVGSQAEGINGGSAVKLANSSNSLMATQIVPGYLTLGTTWSTSVLAKNNDGGTFGGIKLTTRPDGIHFSYKRSVPEGVTTSSTVVAYLWKGTYTQKDVPANIVMAGNPVAVDMVNRDRNILGLETTLGGEVTKSDDAALIAKAIRPIVQVTDDWNELTVPFQYSAEAQPEMFNVIFAANDYFEAEGVVKDVTFTIAEPKLVYWSKLADLTINDETIPGFDGATYTYHVATLPTVSEVSGSVLGVAAEATIEEKDGEIVITVVNNDGVDETGTNTHTYIITAKEAATPGEPQSFEGTLTVEMGGSDITDGGVDATVTITPYSDGTCTFLLPNLTLGDLGTIGDIMLDGVKAETVDGTTTYTGAKEGMKLMDGAITANVTLDGTVTADGKAEMNIDVVWVDANMPIKVKFAGQDKAGINSINIDNSRYEVEYFDLRGIRVNSDSLIPGIYIRRQGSDVSKIIVR